MPQLTLEQRVDRLESIDAIKRLKALYCMYCDAKYDAEGICSLFVEDGVWDGGSSFGRYEGHQQSATRARSVNRRPEPRFPRLRTASAARALAWRR